MIKGAYRLSEVVARISLVTNETCELCQTDLPFVTKLNLPWKDDKIVILSSSLRFDLI